MDLEPSNADQALTVLADMAWEGVTYKELLGSGQYDGHGHGSASAALTRLHKSGLIARLHERRDGCSVYVLPKYLAGRDHVPARSYTNEAREERADIATVWALLGQIASCTCECTCGARTGVTPSSLPARPNSIGPGSSTVSTSGTGTVQATASGPEPSRCDDEERMLLEWAG